MAGKILVLRWTGSAYDSLGGLLELTAQEFVAEGHHVTLFVAHEQDWPTRLGDLLRQGGYSFALGMSGMGADIVMQGGRLLWEAAGVPFFNWNCDHACRFPRRHTIRNRFIMHGYVFPDHARYSARHLNPNGATFAVHIGMPRRTIFPGAPLPLDQRNGRIMFTKSSGDSNAIEERWRSANPTVRRLLFTAAEALFHRGVGDYVSTLQEIAEPCGMLLDGNSVLTLTLMGEIEAYLRFRHTNLVAEVVRRYPVDVFGGGWDHFDWSGGQATFHGAADFRSTLQRMPSYLGCLSTNPVIEESVHDRVFFALAAGSVPLSNSNAFSRQHMPMLEPYSFGFTVEAVERAIDAMLSEPQQALDRTEAAQQALASDFTMRNAARQISHFAALHRTNMRCAA